MLKVDSIQQIVEKAKNLDQIVCFGAGKNFARLEELLSDTAVWGKIKYIIDNDEKKQGRDIVIGGKTMKVLSLADFKTRNYSNYAIIITCGAYTEILKQLEEDTELRDIDFYCLTHLYHLRLEEEALQKEIPSKIELYDKPIIPKAIHYCWFGGKPLPDKYKMWMESWQKFCPDYDIIEWNESNYDVTKNEYMYQAYKCKKWGFVPDYARLDIIYNHGGIYLDTDVELIRPIDALLYQKGFAGFQSRMHVNLGAGFGAVKGLPIIKKMMDIYDNMQFVNKNGSLNMTVSPILQTDVLKEYGLDTNGEYQIINDLTIYPEKMLNGKNLYTRRIVLKPYTRAVHHFDGSWAEESIRRKNIRIEEEMMKYNICEI